MEYKETIYEKDGHIATVTLESSRAQECVDLHHA